MRESIALLLGFQRSLPVSNCRPPCCGLPARAELRRPFPRDARSRLPLAIRTGFMDQDTFFQFYGRESTILYLMFLFWALVKLVVTFRLLSSLLLDSTVYVCFFCSSLFLLFILFFTFIFLDLLSGPYLDSGSKVPIKNSNAKFSELFLYQCPFSNIMLFCYMILMKMKL